MKKYILILLVALYIPNSAFSYIVVIKKTFLSHDPKDKDKPNYNYVKRDVNDIKSPFDPNVIVERDISIFCEGNGPNTCPNSIAAPTDNPDPSNFMTLEAVNALQNLLDVTVINYESNGNMNNSNGTISTPDGMLYNYIISWQTNSNGGHELMLTFQNQ